MNRIIVLAAACLLAPLASAQLYKYVDKDGKTVYTDQPPPDAIAKPVYGGANAAPAPAPKTFVDRDKELQKGRDKVRDEAKKADDKANLAARREEDCKIATSNARMYEEGGRMMKTNEQGERVFLSDEELEAAKAKSRREVEEACKKS
ncbi:MAG TPA: DUF4124 domain-containing protein [Usitatibacter sp.]|jgi:hypothetical protein|nr:DUF4124 domain-containing protein [Usitatibacter sp.]